MAFANANFTDIVATTIQTAPASGRQRPAQQPLLARLKAKGNVRPFSGGNVILEELMYVDSTTNNINSYSGYEVVNISPNSPISAAQFPITQYRCRDDVGPGDAAEQLARSRSSTCSKAASRSPRRS
jgi:hypothetical protein